MDTGAGSATVGLLQGCGVIRRRIVALVGVVSALGVLAACTDDDVVDRATAGGASGGVSSTTLTPDAEGFECGPTYEQQLDGAVTAIGPDGRVIWERSIGWVHESSLGSFRGLGDAALAGDRVLVVTEEVRSGKRTLLAIRAVDGSVVWTASGDVELSMVFADAQTVVVVDGHYTADQGFVAALDVATGAELWRVDDTGEVLAAVVANSDAVVATLTEGLTALDLRSGERLWEVQDHGYATLVEADRVLSTSAGYADSPGQSTLYSLRTGEQRWTAPVGFDFGTAVGIDDVIVGVHRRDELVALDSDSGTERWRRDHGSTFGLTAVSLEDASAVVVAYGGDERTTAIDARSGSVSWSVEGGGLITPASGFGIVLIEGDRGSTNLLLGLDASSGDLRWQRPLGEFPWVDPSPFEDGFVVGAGERFEALHNDGTVIWEHATSPRAVAAPAQADGTTTYVVSADPFEGDRDCLDFRYE